MADYYGLSGWYSQYYSFYDKKGKPKKEHITRLNIASMLRRTMQMFKWDIKYKGEPCETITNRSLELLVQTNGMGGVVEYENKLYCLFGTMGGQPNYNFMPTKFIWANAALGASGEENIYDFKDMKRTCVIIPNDSLYQGLVPILTLHCEQLTEIELTKRAIMIWLRAPHTFAAGSNNAFRDVTDYISKLYDGELSAVLDKNVMNPLKVLADGNNNGTKGIMTSLLESQQYEKASMFNNVGLDMNYNMKRETITSSEAQLGESALLPLPDDMFAQREKAAKEMMEVFDCEVSVEFNSAWKNLRVSIQLALEKERTEAQGMQTFQPIGNNNVEVSDGKPNETNSDSTGDDSDGRDDNSGLERDNEPRDVGGDGTTETVVEKVIGELDMATQQLEQLAEEGGVTDEEDKTN